MRRWRREGGGEKDETFWTKWKAGVVHIKILQYENSSDVLC
jgi:hypothetical protein